MTFDTDKISHLEIFSSLSSLHDLNFLLIPVLSFSTMCELFIPQFFTLTHFLTMPGQITLHNNACPIITLGYHQLTPVLINRKHKNLRNWNSRNFLDHQKVLEIEVEYKFEGPLSVFATRTDPDSAPCHLHTVPLYAFCWISFVFRTFVFQGPPSRM